MTPGTRAPRRLVDSRGLAAAYPALWPSHRALDTARWRGTSPPYLKSTTGGVRARVLYDLDVVEQWIEEHYPLQGIDY